MVTRRKFSDEFKLEVVKMVVEGGARISQLSQNLNIGENVIHRWVKQYKSELSGAVVKGVNPLTPDQKRIRELENENQQLKSDVDLLKKASAFFAKTIK